MAGNSAWKSGLSILGGIPAGSIDLDANSVLARPDPAGGVGSSLALATNTILLRAGGNVQSLAIAVNQLPARLAGNLQAVGVSSAANVDSVVIRDALGRTQMAAGSADADVVIRSQGDETRNGIVAVARLFMPNQPVDTNTIGIGADVYEFDSGGGVTAPNIAVTIGGSAAATRANLISAINTLGTAFVRADEVGTAVMVRSAVTRGGSATPADPNVALTEAITDALDFWDVGNVNLNTLSGQAYAYIKQATAVLTVNAGMVTAASFFVADFPFTPSGFTFQVRTSAGVIKLVTDAVTIVNTAILYTLAGATQAANTDVITITAWQ